MAQVWIGSTDIVWMLSVIGGWHVGSHAAIEADVAVRHALGNGWLTTRTHYAPAITEGVLAYELTDAGLGRLRRWNERAAAGADKMRNWYRASAEKHGPLGRRETRRDNMSISEKAAQMRHAIDMIEGALMGCGKLIDIPDIFEGSPDELEIAPKLVLREVRRVCAALSECTRIINSDDFTPHALVTSLPLHEHSTRDRLEALFKKHIRLVVKPEDRDEHPEDQLWMVKPASLEAFLDEAALAAAPPAPVQHDDAILPCDVSLPPALVVTKGCKLSTLMAALRARGMLAAAPVQEDGWQPIETANLESSDGVIVSTDTGVVGEARYFPDEGRWYWAGNDPHDYHDGSIDTVAHWQPLPAPPVIVAEKDATR